MCLSQQVCFRGMIDGSGRVGSGQDSRSRRASCGVADMTRLERGRGVRALVFIARSLDSHRKVWIGECE